MYFLSSYCYLSTLHYILQLHVPMIYNSHYLHSLDHILPTKFPARLHCIGFLPGRIALTLVVAETYGPRAEVYTTYIHTCRTVILYCCVICTGCLGHCKREHSIYH